MAVIFEEDWSSLNFAAWEFPVGRLGELPPSYRIIPTAGCDGGPAFTCSFFEDGNEVAILGQQIGDQFAPIPSLAFRLQAAFLNSDAGFEIPFFECSNCYNDINNGGCDSTNFACFVRVTTSGKIRFLISDLAEFDSADGVVLNDGTNQAFQFVFNFPDANTLNYDIVVDNVSVISGTYVTVTPPPPDECFRKWGFFNPPSGFTCEEYFQAGGINQFYVSVCRAPQTCVPAVVMSANSLVQVDTDGTVIDFPACAAEKLTPPMCITTHTLSTLTFDCDTNQIVIAGTGFVTQTSVSIRGPENVFVNFGTKHTTPTEIRLGSLSVSPATTPGKYCVTVHDPCT